MSISDTERLDAARRWLATDSVWTLLCAVFSAVYESFSHNVISLWMVLLFLFPLLGGVIPALLLVWRGKAPRIFPLALWRCGVATLGVGSCVKGILEIYGTSSGYQIVYWVAGTGLLAAGTPAFLKRPPRTGSGVKKWRGGD